MRLMRARLGEEIALVRVEGEQAVVLARESAHPAADVLREALASGIDLAGGTERVEVGELTPLAPVANPAKILCVGLNYADHAAESGMEAPKAPVVFGKYPNTLVGPGETVTFDPAASEQVDYEAELAVVIGTRARDVSEDEAPRHVLGYTIANDVSARDVQFADGQWLRGKSFDTFCPVGPEIVTPDELDDVQKLSVACRVNGVTLQDDTTAHMIHSVAAILSYVSRFLTLEPGDLVLTGTPDGVGFARQPAVFLGDGDTVEVEISGLGVLRNPIRHRTR
jgi:2-keto-4-pentenoate hydratase/2-oxohepta-3-ene-1,7-dioic acid hydratase in catechol pathway